MPNATSPGTPTPSDKNGEEQSDTPTQTPPPQTLLVLVRHGRTPTTGSVLPGRTPGLHLSPEGQIEAAATAQRLLSAYPTPAAIYSSPMERALETAEPYSVLSKVAVEVNEALVECEFGDWTGRELKELAQLPEWRMVQSQPSRFRFPSGESFAEMSARMTGFLAMVSERHPGSVVVAYSHADPIKALVADVLGLHLDLFQRIIISTATPSIIGIVDGSPSILSVNTSATLPGKVF
ncbi:MAG: histidine phosphatase family protein [Acidimicrobiales bacterium]